MTSSDFEDIFLNFDNIYNAFSSCGREREREINSVAKVVISLWESFKPSMLV
jgi:hypothetical protein